MNRKNFIKSAALLAGAATVIPTVSAGAAPKASAAGKVALRKSLGFGMIKEETAAGRQIQAGEGFGFRRG